MRENESINPTLLSEFPNYYLVYDPKISIPEKQNIILKPHALVKIADYYFKKYAIKIHIHTTFIKISNLADLVHLNIQNIKNNYPELTRAGFVFMSDDDPDDQFGHALPMLWEKESNGKEHIFFLDTTQLLGKTDFDPTITAFRKKLYLLNPDRELWAMYGKRQIDYSSCYTDALVILKDALCQFSLKALVKIKKKHHDQLTEFYMPEILCRTTQPLSLLNKSQSDENKIVHFHHEKNTEKQTTSVTLKMWVEQYSDFVTVNGGSKRFGTFALFKARKYVEKLDNLEKKCLQV